MTSATAGQQPAGAAAPGCGAAPGRAAGRRARRRSCGSLRAHDSVQLRKNPRQRLLEARRASRSSATAYVARAAFSSWVSWRAVRSSSASCPRAAARSRRTASSATTAIVASNAASMPDSNSSGTSTTSARGAGARADSRLAPRGDPLPDARPQQLLEPLALLVGRERARATAGGRPTAGRDVVAPALHDGGAHLGVVVELVHDRVGRQRRGAEALRARRAPPTSRRRCRPSGRRTAGLGLALQELLRRPLLRPAASGAAGSSSAEPRPRPRLGASASASAGASTSSTGASAARARSAKTSSDRPSSGMSSRSPASPSESVGLVSRAAAPGPRPA